MEDEKIIELYFERDEHALIETQNKYENYLKSISFGVVRSRQDAEECVNDTYQKAWESIPPKRPNRLSTYLAKITRNLSISRLIYNNAQKRDKKLNLLLSEVEEIIAGDEGDMCDDIILKQAFDDFLSRLEIMDRVVFVKRYFYAWQINEIAREYRLSESNVKVMLFRTRKKLKEYLEREGLSI